MAKSDGSVRINTLVDTKGFDKGMNTMQQKIGGLSGSIGKLGATIAATFAVKKLIQFGKQAIDLGSDLQEVQNVVDVTFTTMSDKVNEFAQGAAEAAGLSETMAKRYVGTFGAMAKAFGFAEGESYNMATALTQLAGDVASFYNLTQDEAYTKLKSVFTGETESLKDLGVVMTQSALDSFAMAKGWGKTTAAMEENEKVALRFAFVTEQLNAASGDFIRTQDSWANQTRILSLNFDTFKANIGQALINIFTPFLKVINQIVDKMAELSQHFVAFSELLVGKSTSGGGGSPSEALAEISEAYNDVADATNEANKAQNKYLTGLDEIKTFTDKKNGTDSIIRISGITTANLISDEMQKEMSEVEKNVQDFKNKLQEIFRRDWKETSDLIADYILNGIFNFEETEIGQKLEETKEKVFSVIETFLGDFWDEITDPEFSTMQNTLGQSFSDWLLENIFKVDDSASPEEARAIVIQKIKDEIVEIWNAMTAEDFVPIQNQLGEKVGEIIREDLLGWSEDETIITKVNEWLENLGNNIWNWWNSEIVAEWDSTVGRWWTNNVKPWFTKEKWLEVLSGIEEAFESIWNGALNIAIFALNTIIDSMNDLASIEWDPITILGKQIVPGGSAKLFEIPKIPYLASGAVIPPNAPFMAMLGDQKHGTNIEAPLDTIKQAVREVIGNGGGGKYAFTAQINRRTLFEEVIDEAKLRQSTSGRNPFDLA